MRKTWGTETSKYPEEKKETTVLKLMTDPRDQLPALILSIPLVVASERGRVQTLH